MKLKSIVIALTVATGALAEDLSQLFEKAYYLDTGKGQQKKALEIYREIAATEVTPENKATVIKALKRLLALYDTATAAALKTALQQMNLDFEKGPASADLLYPANWGGGGQGYEITADGKVKHSGKYACRIRKTEGDSGFATITGHIPPHLLAGRKVRISGTMKLDAVSGMAGLWMRADKESQPVAFYNMSDRQIKGTADWQEYRFELDIPTNIDNVNFGALCSGSGTLWVDDITIELID